MRGMIYKIEIKCFDLKQAMNLNNKLTGKGALVF